MFRNFISYNQVNLSLWTQDLEEIEAKVQSLATGKKQHIDLLKQLNDQTSRITKKINKAKKFISDLEHNPEILVKILAEEINNVLFNFKQVEYICNDELFNIVHNTNEIIQTILEENNHQENCKTLWREKYAILCGWICNMTQYTNFFKFADVEQFLLKKIHIPDYEIVPGVQDSKNCKQKFTEFKNNHAELFSVDKNKLKQARLSDMKLSISRLGEVAQKDNSSLHKEGLSLFNTLEKKLETEKKWYSFLMAKDIRFYTCTAKIAANTLESPRENFGELITITKTLKRHKKSHPIIGKLLCFAAVVLEVISILGFAGTLGIATPLCAIGVGLGVGLGLAGLYFTGDLKIPKSISQFNFFNQHNATVLRAISSFDKKEHELKKNNLH